MERSHRQKVIKMFDGAIPQTVIMLVKASNLAKRFLGKILGR
jgi:hypothetical protein